VKFSSIAWFTSGVAVLHGLNQDLLAEHHFANQTRDVWLMSISGAKLAGSIESLQQLGRSQYFEFQFLSCIQFILSGNTCFDQLRWHNPNDAVLCFAMLQLPLSNGTMMHRMESGR
jgi:hypothetical protein